MKDWKSQAHVKWECKYHVVILLKWGYMDGHTVPGPNTVTSYPDFSIASSIFPAFMALVPIHHIISIVSTLSDISLKMGRPC